MTNSSNNIVLFTLAMSDQPLSIADIAFRCGLSYNTVKKIVWEDERVQKEAGFPALYTVEKPELFDMSVMTVKYDKPEEGWLTWLNSIRPLLVSITAMSETMGKEELEKKASMFKSLGRSFLSLGKDLESLMDNDEWAHYLNWSEDGTP